MSDIPINRVVDVQISIAGGGVKQGDFGLACVFGTSDVLTPQERKIAIATMSDMLSAGYTQQDEEYKQVQTFLSQQTTPPIVWVARWVKNPASGYFKSNPTDTALSELLEIKTGALKVTIDGDTEEVIGLNFESVASWDDVADIIEQGIQDIESPGFVAATVKVIETTSGVYFYVTSGTTGDTSTVGPCEAPATGTDITLLLNLREGVSVDGADSETPIEAVQAISAIDDSFFGVLFTKDLRDTDAVLDLAAYIQSIDKTYFTVTQDTNTLTPNNTTNRAYKAKAAGYTKTMFCYSDIDQYIDASIMSAMFTVDFSGVNTVKNPKFRPLPGITAVNLTSGQLQTLESMNCNTAISVKGATFFSDGRMSGMVGGGIYYFDTLHFIFWLKDYIATNMLNLFLSTNKVPYSDTGVQQEVQNLANSLQQGVVNGGLSPLLDPNNTDKTLPAYTILPPALVATVSASDRNARKSPPLQFTANGSGAINYVKIIGTVVQ